MATRLSRLVGEFSGRPVAFRPSLTTGVALPCAGCASSGGPVVEMQAARRERTTASGAVMKIVYSLHLSRYETHNGIMIIRLAGGTCQEIFYEIGPAVIMSVDTFGRQV